MPRTNPIGKIKDLTVETLKSPRTAAGKALDQAKGAAATGLTVADHVTRSAVSTVGGLVQQRRGRSATDGSREKGSDETSAPSAPASRDRTEGSPARPDGPGAPDTSEPVNVVEELGLDPAPADDPTAPDQTSPGDGAEVGAPETSIDAAADPDAVTVTPAEVAQRAAKKAPAKKAPAKKAPAKKAPVKKAAAKKAPAKKAPAKKAPAKKAAPEKSATASTPSAKLPPRSVRTDDGPAPEATG